MAALKATCSFMDLYPERLQRRKRTDPVPPFIPRFVGVLDRGRAGGVGSSRTKVSNCKVWYIRRTSKQASQLVFISVFYSGEKIQSGTRKRYYGFLHSNPPDISGP